MCTCKISSLRIRLDTTPLISYFTLIFVQYFLSHQLLPRPVSPRYGRNTEWWNGTTCASSSPGDWQISKIPLLFLIIKNIPQHLRVCCGVQGVQRCLGAQFGNCKYSALQFTLRLSKQLLSAFYRRENGAIVQSWPTELSICISEDIYILKFISDGCSL